MRNLIWILALVFIVGCDPSDKPVRTSFPTRPSPSMVILSAATATGAGSAFEPWGAHRTYQCAAETSAGAGTAAIDIEVSNDGTNYVTAATISLSFDDDPVVDDGFATHASWRYARANVTSISGTGATVNCYIATE